jgi:hypothetical protein
LRRWVILAFCALVALAVAVRLVPFATSSYPYNVDGFPLVKGAERVLADGHWDRFSARDGLEGYDAKMPLFTFLLAEFSLVTGIEPMRCVQLMTPLLGAACAIIGFALARRLTRSDAAALGCMAVLALQGFFVYVTTAAWKEALGLPLLMLVFLLCLDRADPRRRVLLALVLLLLPFVHHLTALVAYSFVVMVAGATLVTKWRDDELTWNLAVREVALGPALAIPAYFYYRGVNLEFFSDVNNVNDAALLGASLLLGLVVAIMLSLPAMSAPWFFFDVKPGKASAALLFDEKSLAVVVGFSALLLNAYVQIFAGTMLTSSALLLGIAPLVLIFLISIAGFNLLRYSESKDKPVIASMAVAVLALMIFSVARAYDPASFFLAYRLLDYIDPFVAVTAGLGLAYLATRVMARYKGKTRADTTNWGGVKGKALVGALAVCFVLALASTTPLAYDGERLFQIRSETLPQEFSACEWASESGVKELSSNAWNADIADPYFEIHSDPLLPYRLNEGKGYGDVPMLLEEEWTGAGAQTLFQERLVISQANFDAALASGDLVYCAGPLGQRVYIVVPGGG